MKKWKLKIDEIFNLMDFDCEQRESVHFFYTLPYSKTKALVETTWLSKMNDSSQKDYDNQIKDYIENHLNLKNYKITYKEQGVIPLFYPAYEKEKNKINIGNIGITNHVSFCANTISVRLNEPTHNTTQIIINPIDTS